MAHVPRVLKSDRSVFDKCFLSMTMLDDCQKRPSQGGYLFPCSPEINWLVPLFPKNRKFVFLCSLFPNIVFVPLKILPLFSCSPEINTLFPLFPKTPGRASKIGPKALTNGKLRREQLMLLEAAIACWGDSVLRRPTEQTNLPSSLEPGQLQNSICI